LLSLVSIQCNARTNARKCGANAADACSWRKKSTQASTQQTQRTKLTQATQQPKRKDRRGVYFCVAYVACVALDGNQALKPLAFTSIEQPFCILHSSVSTYCAGPFCTKLSHYGAIIDIRLIRHVWPQLPDHLDTVMATNRYVYFFKVRFSGYYEQPRH